MPEILNDTIPSMIGIHTIHTSLKSSDATSLNCTATESSFVACLSGDSAPDKEG